MRLDRYARHESNLMEGDTGNAIVQKRERATELIRVRVTPTLKTALERFAQERDMKYSEVVLAALAATPGFKSTVKEVIKGNYQDDSSTTDK